MNRIAHVFQEKHYDSHQEFISAVISFIGEIAGSTEVFIIERKLKEDTNDKA